MGRSQMNQLIKEAGEIRDDVRKNAQRVIDEAEKRNELLKKKNSTPRSVLPRQQLSWIRRFVKTKKRSSRQLKS